MCMHSHHDHAHEGKGQANEPGESQATHPSFWRSRAAIVLLGFAAIAGFFLVTEHWAHLYGILPFLFILACPLMHLFMHHGHGGHGGHAPHGNRQPDGTTSSTSTTPSTGGQS